MLERVGASDDVLSTKTEGVLYPAVTLGHLLRRHPTSDVDQLEVSGPHVDYP